MNIKDLQFGQHSGILEKDSPAAKALILRNFDCSALQQFSTLYTIAAKSGALQEQKINRSPGINFNPRTARIICILIAEAHCRDLEQIDSAISQSANRGLFDLEFLASNQCESFSSKPYLGAYLLDTLRHLHMMTDVNSLILEKQLLALKNLDELNAFAYWPQLNTLLSAAINRSLQRLGKFARAG